MDRNLFTDQILHFIDLEAQMSHSASVCSDITTDTVMMPKTNAYELSEETTKV